MERRRNFPVRLALWVWGLINGARRIVLNFIFVILMVVFISAIFSDKGPTIENGSALLLAPRGVIVEEKITLNPMEEVFAELGDDRPPQTQLRDLLTAMREGAKDDRIKMMVIDTSEMLSAGPSKLAELKEGIAAFKASGKKVLARGDWYTQAGYYLAAQADEVYVDSYGGIDITGFDHTRTFYKSALERFGVKMHVFRVGSYKSAVEPYLRDDMSAEAKSNAEKWLNVLWDGYKTDVASMRKLTPDDLQQYADNMSKLLADQEGDAGKMAQTAGLVDGFKSRIEWQAYMKEMVGADKKAESYKQVDAVAYASTFNKMHLPGQKTVGVIVAQGQIMDGEGEPGNIGGDALAALIRDAREDDDIKAIVLRVDSPGGSAFASEVIRRELVETQKAGKPVVVSMSTLAASGGYWISATADEIIASPLTITGSIGIFGMFPTIDGLVNEYGVHRDGVGTTKLSGAFDIARPLNPEFGNIIQKAIDHGYEKFLGLVGEGRKKSRDEVHAIAQGQVWAGQDALANGLVDKLGNLDVALKSAAERAKLGDSYAVRYVTKPLTPAQEFVRGLSASVSSWMPETRSNMTPALLVPAKLAAQQAKEVLSMNDPRGVYAHCMCEIQ